MKRLSCLALVLISVVVTLAGAPEASAQNTGCVTYVQYVWRADRHTFAYYNGSQAVTDAFTFSENANQSGCLGHTGYSVEVSSFQFFWTPYGYQNCSIGYNPGSNGIAWSPLSCWNTGSDYVNSGHRAWFAGNPWDSSVQYVFAS